MHRLERVDDQTRSFCGLTGIGLLLLAVQLVSPFSGRRFDGNSLDLAFGGLALAAFVTATLWAAAKGSRQTKQASVAFWCVALLVGVVATAAAPLLMLL